MTTLQRGHVCHLCGVPFSIGRMRNVLEFHAAAFTPSWCGRYEGSWWKWAGGCGRKAGCVTAFHYEQIFSDGARRECSFIDAERECILQYMNNPETAKVTAGSALPTFRPGHLPIKASPSEYIRVIPAYGQTEKLLHIGDYDFWSTNDIRRVFRRRLEEEGFIFGYTDDYRKVFPSGTFEHIAGSGCQAFGEESGYSGHSITYDEVSMCRVAQVLSLRDQCRAALVDDEDWERHSDTEWVLGGLTRSTSVGLPIRTFPQRLPSRIQLWSKTTWQWPANRRIGMVFHPTCLEIFKRASIRKHGVFDINRLGRWFVATCNFTIDRFPRHAAVRRGEKELWYHHIGDEWIAANPCYVGGLKSLVQKLSFKTVVQVETPQERTALLEQDRGVDVCEADCKPPLVLLPTELRCLIFDMLSIGSIANIALAYPILTKTACEYLCQRVVGDWPFIWEFWSRTPYSKWTTKTPDELINIYKQFTAEQDNLRSPKVEEPGHIIGWLTESIFAVSGFVPRPALFIDPTDFTGPNFFRLIVVLDNHIQNGSLKGLRNRQRIWTDCEVILDQIERLERYTKGEWDVFAMQKSGKWNKKVSDAFEAVIYGSVNVRGV